MVYIRYDEDTKVITFMHKMPFDKVNGMGKSKEELEKTGVFVDECPEPEKKTGFAPVSMYSEETKSIYYDYLKKHGDTMYEAVDGAAEKEANAELLQGYTEQSNVNVVKEMVDMITITRAYEANQKVIRSYDSMLNQAVNNVGKVGN